jgi:hypothetical protein
VEVFAVLLVLFLVALVALPVLAANRTRSDRIVCANNLRQVGAAFLVWANDRDDRVPFEVPVAEGGTRLHTLAPNAWLHFSWISNELRTPRILLCPSDTGMPARDFTGNPASGYVHPNFANRATSYFLTHQRSEGPMSLLGGDRNFLGADQVGCSIFGTAVRATWPAFNWRPGLHDGEGNVVLVDGQVSQTDTAGLRAAIGRSGDNSGDLHFVAPR